MLNVKAETQMLDTVQDFIHESLEKAGIDADIKALTQLDVAVEEVFVNIANYAYTPDKGDAIIYHKKVDAKKLKQGQIIIFEKEGTVYRKAGEC